MSLFRNKDRYGFDPSRDDFVVVVVVVVLVHAIFEFFHSLAALRHNVGSVRMG